MTCGNSGCNGFRFVFPIGLLAHLDRLSQWKINLLQLQQVQIVVRVRRPPNSMLIFKRLLRSILVNSQICFLLTHPLPVERSNADLVVVLDVFWLWLVNGLLNASDLRGLRLDWLLEDAGVLPVRRGCDGRFGDDRAIVGRLGLLRCSIDCFWFLSAQRECLSILGVPGERGPRYGRLWNSAVAEDFL